MPDQFKCIYMMSGNIHVISIEEYENIKNLINSVKWLELRNGQVLNVNTIAEFGEVQEVPFWQQYRVIENKLGKYFYRDGQKIFLDYKGEAEIEYRMPPEVQRLIDKKSPTLAELPTGGTNGLHGVDNSLLT